jgi:hypothetical protein
MFSCIVKFPPYDPILYVRQITVEEGRWSGFFSTFWWFFANLASFDSTQSSCG